MYEMTIYLKVQMRGNNIMHNDFNELSHHIFMKK